MKTVSERYEKHAAALKAYGQSHVLTWWPELNQRDRLALLADLDQVDLPLCASLLDEYVLEKPSPQRPAHLEPAPALPRVPPDQYAEQYQEARWRGQELIRTGRIAAFTVAGGQGTRLGFEGPKGCFPASTVRGVSLFQLFAESLLGVQRRYGRRPRWYIMTSPQNHAETVAYFEKHGYFGLESGEVRFFPQGQMPAFTPDGRIAMTAPHRLALSPDGHGGSLQALAKSGQLDDMRHHAVEHISYFQVDNPLVHTMDPLFIGLHDLVGSEMASKAVTKASDTERVGNFCLADGKLTVIEYSDLPEEIALARNADGSRAYDAGSIAIHILSRAFVQQLTANGRDCKLPWHRADKTMPVVDPLNRARTPAQGAVVKLEMFVFDALPLAANPLLLMTHREEEFSPIKNATGNDSPATARRDQLRRAARWLEAEGVEIPRDREGDPAMPIEISPAYACEADELKGRVPEDLTLRPGEPLLIA